MKKAFTLAEIMIVLTVIGVLTAILLPAAFHVTPDENIMKFKKANSTLGTAIRELANSDKYYLNGDLGVGASGELLNFHTNHDLGTYFCETFADMLSVKSKNCTAFNASHPGAVDLRYGDQFSNDYTDNAAIEITPELLQKSKEHLDLACKSFFGSTGSIVNDAGEVTFAGSEVQIETTDGIFWWEANPAGSFGFTDTQGTRRHSAPSQHPASFPDSNGFDAIYKIICFDVDGVPASATEDDCVNECPFGYGIRADGKILPGARADEWIEKSVQKGE